MPDSNVNVLEPVEAVEDAAFTHLVTRFTLTGDPGEVMSRFQLQACANEAQRSLAAQLGAVVQTHTAVLGNSGVVSWSVPEDNRDALAQFARPGFWAGRQTVENVGIVEAIARPA